jgi:hypothetical protein
LAGVTVGRDQLHTGWAQDTAALLARCEYAFGKEPIVASNELTAAEIFEISKDSITIVAEPPSARAVLWDRRGERFRLTRPDAAVQVTAVVVVGNDTWVDVGRR